MSHRTVKAVTVEAMFPELKGGSIYKTGHGRAGSAKAAIARAFVDLLSQVKGKRIHNIRATITIVEAAESTIAQELWGAKCESQVL